MVFDLGQLKNLKLREVWAHEEREFTPWLALDENMAQLSAAIGLELQLEHVEVPVGPYCADILAKDPSVGFVVIENQFGKTDHDHLGKPLTYAAALGAGAVVWIAERFTEEHQKSIEWLNDHTNDDLSLYAVQLEVLQIDGSKPAIKFNVLSQPNDVVRAATIAKTSGTLTDAQQLQLSFWTMFRNRLIEKKVLPSAQTPRPQYWFDVALGRSNIHLSNIVDTWGKRIGTHVYISHLIADAALDQLSKEKEAIEKEIGANLQWNPNPEKRDKIIALTRQVDINDRSRWPEYCEWLVDNVVKFRKAFVPRVRQLRLNASNAPSTSQESSETTR